MNNTNIRFWLKDSFLPFVLLFLLGASVVLWSQHRINKGSDDYIKIVVQMESHADIASSADESADGEESSTRRPINPEFIGPERETSWRTLSVPELRKLGAELDRLYRTDNYTVRTANNYFAVLLLLDEDERISAVRDRLLSLSESPAFQSSDKTSRLAILNNLALSYENESDYLKAERFYRSANTIKKNWFSLFGLSYAAIRNKSYGEAEALFNEALNLASHQEHYLLYYSYGLRLAHVGRLEESLIAQSKAIQLQSDFWPAHLAQAVSLRRLSRFKEAEKVYNSLLLAQPYYVKAHFNYGLLLNRLGRQQDALKEFNSALLIDDNNRRARESLAEVYFDNKNYDKAYSQYKILYSRNLHEPKYLYWMGKIDFLLKNYPRSESELRKSIELKGGDYPDAWMKLSDLLLATNRLEEAKKTLEGVARLRPDFAPAYFDLATIAEKESQTSKSVELLRTAIKLKPSSHVYRRKLASVLEAQNDIQGALAELQSAAALDEENIMTVTRLGELLTRMTNYSGANVQFKRAIAMNPKKSVVFYNYGLNQSRLRDCPGALLSYEKAIENSDKEDSSFIAKVLRQRASCHEEIGDQKLAKADLTEAIELRENYSEARADIVDIYLKEKTENSLQQARYVISQGLAFDPNDCQLMKLSVENNFGILKDDYEKRCSENLKPKGKTVKK